MRWSGLALSSLTAEFRVVRSNPARIILCETETDENRNLVWRVQVARFKDDDEDGQPEKCKILKCII
jgi:hypothetical protein